MKIILSIILLTALTACATNRQQTFTEYVVLNKHSNYQGQSMKDWKEQPSENFIGIRLMNWVNQDKK